MGEKTGGRAEKFSRSSEFDSDADSDFEFFCPQFFCLIGRPALTLASGKYDRKIEPWVKNGNHEWHESTRIDSY